MKTHKVVLDTNALMLAAKEKRDIFEDLQKFLGNYEAIVPSFVKAELENKAKSGTGKTKEAAKISLGLLDRVKIIQAEKTGSTDTSILNYAVKNKTWVYTNDKKLKERLQARGIKVIFLRQRKYPAKSEKGKKGS